MKRIVKWLLVSGLICAALLIVALGVRYELKKQAQKKREASYELTLRSYSQVLRPGKSRKEVEDYLRQKDIALVRMCCVEASELSRRHSFDDLTKIGQEDAPWFCSENNVYIALQFDDRGQHGPHWDDNDLDTLRAVSIYRWLEGCL